MEIDSSRFNIPKADPNNNKGKRRSDFIDELTEPRGTQSQ